MQIQPIVSILKHFKVYSKSTTNVFFFINFKIEFFISLFTKSKNFIN